MLNTLQRILILCKTYPSPSSKYAETSCVAGMTEDGKFVRLYPVPFRLVSDDQQFRKWQWIEARVEKANNDHRPESHRLFVDTIQCDAEPLRAGKEGWPQRMQLLSQLPVFDDFAAVQAARVADGTSLALLRPSRIVGLDITPIKNADWTDAEKQKLLQLQQQGGLCGTPVKISDYAIEPSFNFIRVKRSGATIFDQNRQAARSNVSSSSQCRRWNVDCRRKLTRRRL